MMRIRIEVTPPGGGEIDVIGRVDIFNQGPTSVAGKGDPGGERNYSYQYFSQAGAELRRDLTGVVYHRRDAGAVALAEAVLDDILRRKGPRA